MTRGAPATVLEDRTALFGAGIDVAVRVGWTARTARLTTAPRPSMAALAGRIGVSPTTVHRLELGELRHGSLLTRYEEGLDLAPGSLRAAVDVLCRTFPADAPHDVAGGPALRTVPEVSSATERLLDGESDGGLWLDWARALSGPGAVGLPERLARGLVARLVGELGRAVGAAYPSRYEALALLRCSGYGHVVLEVAQEVVADPEVQVLNDLMSAVGEAVDDRAVAWCLALLSDPREHVVVGGALALENMAQISGDPRFWSGAVGSLVPALAGAAPGSARQEWLSHLVRLMPRSLRARVLASSGADLAPATRRPRPSPSRVAADADDCRRRARAVATGLGLPEQPVLARLLFDVAHSPLESRAVTSYVLLGALPALAGPVLEELSSLAGAHPDADVRRRLARRLAGSRVPVLPEVAVQWLRERDDGSHDLASAALLLHGAAARPVPDAVLAEAWRVPSLVPAALAALGMAGDRRLHALARDAGHPASGGARWWRRSGARVTR